MARDESTEVIREIWDEDDNIGGGQRHSYERVKKKSKWAVDKI